MIHSWQALLKQEKNKDYFKKLQAFLEDAYKNKTIYPAKENIYQALKFTPLEEVKVVILGQDPYHGPYQAHGLSFSVENSKAKFPPSLRNIFKEIKSDVNVERTNMNLSDWAKQGVLMLNTVLTVEAGKAASHRHQGWEIFTDKIIETLNAQKRQIIFVLWGNEAKKKLALITNPSHKTIIGVHPSPLSVRHGFFGSKPFSQINQYLRENNEKEIVWG